MTRRRRLFEIELPEELAEAGEGAETADGFTTVKSDPPRRGPMAAAVRETAESLETRRAVETEIRAENDRLAHAHAAALAAGLVLERVPLDRIDATRLTRDRRADAPDPELRELKASIARVGLSNPIRLERSGEGAEARFELIQGWRRLSAFRALHAETGEDRFATIPAAVTAPDPEIERAYRRMVDENLVRKDVSFAEMARLALDYAEDPATELDDPAEAVGRLFASASGPKRSHIRAFVEMLEVFGPHLRWPEAIPRNLGLAVRRAMIDGDLTRADLIQALTARPGRDAETEIGLLRAFARASEADEDGPPPGFTTVKPRRSGGASRLRFALAVARGTATVTAADGRLELRAEADFAAMDRGRLEAAAEAFFRALDG